MDSYHSLTSNRRKKKTEICTLLLNLINFLISSFEFFYFIFVESYLGAIGSFLMIVYMIAAMFMILRFHLKYAYAFIIITILSVCIYLIILILAIIILKKYSDRADNKDVYDLLI